MAPDYSTTTVFYNFATSQSAPIIAVYLILVFLSPRLMKHFSPLDLRRPLIFHNLLCSVFSLGAVLVFLVGLYQVGGNLFSKDKDNNVIRQGMWIYWLSKLYELLDTIFMILRHRVRQISFLHVFHHSSITLLADWAYHITPTPAAVPILLLNSFIHVIMYGYYFLTAQYPLHDFTWKKRITQFQIVQFLIGITHGIFGWLYHGFCVYSIFYGLSMLLLFSNFYYKTFILKSTVRSYSTGEKVKLK